MLCGSCVRTLVLGVNTYLRLFFFLLVFVSSEHDPKIYHPGTEHEKDAMYNFTETRGKQVLWSHM